MEITNKKAYFNYFIEKEIEAGIVLKGSEIKAIRKGSCNIKDSYVRIKNDEAYLINAYIERYDESSLFNHEPTRERKLLLHKKEIKKLYEMVKMEGITLVPLRLYIKNGHAKVLIGVGKGKKQYDKRETIKKRDISRTEYDW